MRISANSRDPDYFGPDNWGRYSVTLNGEPLRHCISADDVAGIAVVQKFDVSGKLLVDWRSMQVETEALAGAVKIIDKRAES